MEILVDASDARYPVLSRIYSDACRAISREFAARLMESINKAQSALIADQVAMAIASRDAVTAEERRRRFGGRPVPPHTNGAGPTPPESNAPADEPTT
ncbi:hypothetical protein ACH4TV_19510 [Streptomyces sp. NPDC020898]|uniref:hypothetical protein n=1 Tax=Streptomyces sp. NPDC020898 TaxID=3365101 RepID=UPI003799A9AD